MLKSMLVSKRWTICLNLSAIIDDNFIFRTIIIILSACFDFFIEAAM